MILPHCKRDGTLLVYDAGHWQCLWCSYSIAPAEQDRRQVWQWPPALRPLGDRHSTRRQTDDPEFS